MAPPTEFLLPPEIGVELIYSFVIILCSFMIYYATREMYELSSYKGLKYFRQAFLFFAIAYFFRYFIRFVIFFFNLNEILDWSPRLFGFFSLLLFIYFSTIAIFYLLYSVMWKRWGTNRWVIYLMHILVILIAGVCILTRSILVYLILHVLLLLVIIFVLLVVYKESGNNKGKGLYITYLLLFIFWILNILDLLLPHFLEFYRIIIYLVSSALFMLILYKVLKKSGS